MVAQVAFQPDHQRQIDADHVRPADDGLGHVLGQRDPAAGDQCHFIPRTLLDQRLVDLADHLLEEQRLFHADLVAVGVGHDVQHFDFRQPGQFDGPRAPSASSDPDRNHERWMLVLDLLDAVDHVGPVADLDQFRLRQGSAATAG